MTGKAKRKVARKTPLKGVGKPTAKNCSLAARLDTIIRLVKVKADDDAERNDWGDDDDKTLVESLHAALISLRDGPEERAIVDFVGLANSIE